MKYFKLSLCRCRGPFVERLFISTSQGVYDGVKPPGVDQDSIDSFNFPIKRREQICKDCEMRLSVPSLTISHTNLISVAETLSIAKYAQKSTRRRMSLGNNSECPVIVPSATIQTRRRGSTEPLHAH